MLNLPSQCLKHIAAANQLVVDESAPTIKRILALANGELAAAEDNTKYPIPNTRIYSRAPDIVSIEYVINRALGTPGAKPIAAESRTANDVEDALADIAHELAHLDPNADPLDPEGPLRSILGEVAKRRKAYRESQAVLEQRVIDFLPTAIERMKELCAGITIRRETNGKTRTYTLRPNRRAIEHISRRIQGTSTPIVDSLNDANIPAPDLTREYTEEDIQKMTTTQIITLVQAAEAQEKKQTKSPKQNQQTSNKPPSPIYGRRAGDEGYIAGDEGYIAGDEGCDAGAEGCDAGAEGCNHATAPTKDNSIELPAYYTDACVQMAEFLPTAISHMKTLAQGASTIVETGTGDRDVIDHAPDPRANQFLIDLFIGAPTSCFITKSTEPIDLSPNAEPIAHYTDAIVKLCTAHPAHANQEDHVRTLLQQLTENI